MEKYGVGGILFFKHYAFAKLLRSPEKLCITSPNFCILSQRYMCSLAKPVLDKHYLFTSQHAVVHTAPYVHNEVVHSFILNLYSNIKKYSLCLVQGTVLGHSKMLNVT